MREVILSWLIWLEPHAQVTWQVVSASLCLLLLISTHYAEKGSLSKYIWLGLALVFYLIIKIPLLSWRETSPDENDWWAAAITLKEYPTFWWTHCFWTSRPLTVIPLWALDAIGVEISYTSAKILQFVMQFLSVAIFLATLHRIPFIRCKYYCTLIFWALLAVENQANSISYNSEDVCLLLSIVLLYLTVRLIETPKPKYCILIGGVLFGAILAKEQFIPLAAAYCLGLIVLWLRNDLPRNTVLYTIISLVSLLALLVSVQALSGGLEMLAYMAESVIHYAAGSWVDGHDTQSLPSIQHRAKYALMTILITPDLFSFYVPFGLLIIAMFLTNIFYRRKCSLSPHSIMAASLLAGAILAIVIPAMRYTHYFNLLHVPAAIFLVCHLAETADTLAQKFPTISKGNWLKCSLILVFGSTASYAIAHGNDALVGIKTSKRVTYSPDVVEEYLNNNSKAGDRLIVWGYFTKYHTSANLSCGSRFRYPLQTMRKTSMSEREVMLYRKDILAFRPKFIVDVSEFEHSLMKDENLSLDKFPSLHSIIEREYNLVQLEQGARVHVLKSK